MVRMSAGIDVVGGSVYDAAEFLPNCYVKYSFAEMACFQPKESPHRGSPDVGKGRKPEWLGYRTATVKPRTAPKSGKLHMHAWTIYSQWPSTSTTHFCPVA